MSFPRYPEYKDSGVEWLGAVPVHWGVKRLKRNMRLLTEKTDRRDHPVALENIEGWTGRFKTTETEFQGEGIAFEPDDILFGKLRPYLAKAYCAEFAGEAVGDFHVMRPVTGINSQFAKYQILNREFIDIVDGSTFGSKMPRASWDFVGEMLVTTPSFQEQTKIAVFLDHETAKIDALVDEQRRLIELLKEKRQAVISNAVTRGLNPNAPMKPSGIEWLGDVPAHWELMATKRLFSLVVEPAPDDNDHELLSIYTEIGVRPRKSLEAKGNKATTTDGYWMVKKGDLIVNKLLAWMGAIGISDYDGVTSPAYDILRQKIPLKPRFYDFLFRCGILFTEFRRYSRGIMDMRLRLYFDELGQLLMPYPPIVEQQEIIEFLQTELAKLDELGIEAKRAIDLLQERRTALISAVVTGKIDVRGITK